MIDLLCKDCGNPFSISLEEKTRFEQKKMTLPKRCKNCRKLEAIEQKLKAIRKVAATILYFVNPNKEASNNNGKPKLQTKQSKRTESSAPARA